MLDESHEHSQKSEEIYWHNSNTECSLFSGFHINSSIYAEMKRLCLECKLINSGTTPNETKTLPISKPFSHKSLSQDAGTSSVNSHS